MRNFLFLLAFLGLALHASSETLAIGPGFKNAKIVKKEILDDTSKVLGVDDILARGENLPFLATNRVNFGFQDNPFWFRAELVNLSGSDLFVLLLDQPIFDELDVYLVGEGNAVLANFHQDYTDLSATVQAGRVPAFRLNLPAGRYSTLLVRVESKATVKFSVELHTEASYAEWMAATAFFFGTLLGSLVVILLYNIFLFISIRDRAYGYYILYLCSNLLMSLYFSGMAYPLFFSNNAWAYFNSFQVILATIYFFLTFTSLLFSQQFLMMSAGPARRSLRAYIVFAGLLTAAFLSGIASQRIYYTVLNSTNLLLIVFLLVLGMAKAKEGFRPALYYLIAWSLNGLGMLVTIFEVFGLLPTSLATYNGSLIGAVFEVVFLSFALGDRINAARSEKEIAQTKLIEEQEISLAQRTAQANSFARFVPADFLRILGRGSIAEVRLGDHVEREMTVLFSDIRAFATISEAMTPGESFEFINAYLGRIGPIIKRNGGFIDKYIGDAIMALFPEQPSDATRCAVDMMRELRSFNKAREARGEMQIAIGIGVHCGKLILGTVGEDGRMDTTVISDVVNTASRLEGLTKFYGSSVIFSDEVLRHPTGGNMHSASRSRRLDLVRVKGRTTAVRIHELYAGQDESRHEVLDRTRARFESAGDLYRRGDIADALRLFEEVLDIDGFDNAAKIFRERCLDLLGKGLPPDWDGTNAFMDK